MTSTVTSNATIAAPPVTRHIETLSALTEPWRPGDTWATETLPWMVGAPK